MPDYRIDETEGGIAIELTNVGERQAAMLESLGECAEGRCSCPTDEYEKVAAMEVRPSADRIEIQLAAKPGERLDTTEIAACLDYTVADR